MHEAPDVVLDHRRSPFSFSKLVLAEGNLIEARAEVERARAALILAAESELAGDDGPRFDRVATIYWNYPDVPVGTIASAIGLTSQEIRRFVDPLVVDLPCSSCGDYYDFEVKSRADLAEIRRPKRSWRSPVCGDCHTRQETNRQEQFAAATEYRRVRVLRIEELRSMPYRDYLLTSEWRETRSHALRRARYRCQLCNQNDSILDVHHRTYERLGEEDYRDLIVLCRECHSHFHSGRKVAR